MLLGGYCFMAQLMNVVQWLVLQSETFHNDKNHRKIWRKRRFNSQMFSKWEYFLSKWANKALDHSLYNWEGVTGHIVSTSFLTYITVFIWDELISDSVLFCYTVKNRDFFVVFFPQKNIFFKMGELFAHFPQKLGKCWEK